MQSSQKNAPVQELLNDFSKSSTVAYKIKLTQNTYNEYFKKLSR